MSLFEFAERHLCFSGLVIGGVLLLLFLAFCMAENVALARVKLRAIEAAKKTDKPEAKS